MSPPDSMSLPVSMTLPRSLLVANRGEIAIRVIRATRDLGVRTVAVSPLDDAAALHNLKADITHTLPGRGARAYLDIDVVIAVAVETGCDAIHPGYGFLAENAAFATACAAAGLMFIGPRPDVLELFGDKVTARRAAQRAGVAVLAGSDGPLDAAGAEAFLAGLGPDRAMMLKAVAGGGGRGMRVVRDTAEVAEAFARCVSEATTSFGNGAVFAEEFLPVARHIEVQILGDGTGAVAHLGERDCSVQRRNQKLIEIAPAPWLPARARI